MKFMEVIKRDDRGNVIYAKTKYGFEFWKTYNERDEVIHYKDNRGNEKEYVYSYPDQNNENVYTNKVTYTVKDISKGDEVIREFDERGNMIYYYDLKNGVELYREYDANNNMIHMENSNKYEEYREFDDRNNLIHCKRSNGYEFWKEYDMNNNQIHVKDNEGYERYFVYDESGKLVKVTNELGERFDVWYDEFGFSHVLID